VFVSDFNNRRLTVAILTLSDKRLIEMDLYTHSTNEDLLNIKRKGDPISRTLSRMSDITETWNPCVIKVILLACSTDIDIFKFY
jgi:hypothetical protein